MGPSGRFGAGRGERHCSASVQYPSGLALAPNPGSSADDRVIDPIDPNAAPSREYPGADARGGKCWGISTIGRSAANDAGFVTTTGRSDPCPRTVGWAP